MCARVVLGDVVSFLSGIPRFRRWFFVRSHLLCDCPRCSREELRKESLSPSLSTTTSQQWSQTCRHHQEQHEAQPHVFTVCEVCCQCRTQSQRMGLLDHPRQASLQPRRLHHDREKCLLPIRQQAQLPRIVLRPTPGLPGSGGCLCAQGRGPHEAFQSSSVHPSSRFPHGDLIRQLHRCSHKPLQLLFRSSMGCTFPPLRGCRVVLFLCRGAPAAQRGIALQRNGRSFLFSLIPRRILLERLRHDSKLLPSCCVKSTELIATYLIWRRRGGRPSPRLSLNRCHVAEVGADRFGVITRVLIACCLLMVSHVFGPRGPRQASSSQDLAPLGGKVGRPESSHLVAVLQSIGCIGPVKCH